MFVAVKFLVNRWIGRPKIGTQIDHFFASLAQRDGVGCSGAVRHGQKKKVGLLSQGRVGGAIDKSQRAQFAWESMNRLGKRFASVLPGRD